MLYAFRYERFQRNKAQNACVINTEGPRSYAAAVLDIAMCPSVLCLSVTSRYCIETTQQIVRVGLAQRFPFVLS